MKCCKGFEVKTLSSNGGHYIGTTDNGAPMCRVSDYYKSKEEAATALEEKSFTLRKAAEIAFCNEGRGCW